MSAPGSINYTFEIVSPKHGTFVVTVPTRFRDEIERLKWFVRKCDGRAEGRQFDVIAHSPQVKKKRRKTIYLHALVWQLAGNEPADQIDHRDGQPLNNSEDNLRAATPGQNQANRGLRRNNTSGRIGVRWHTQRGKWAAGLSVDRKHIHLGLFDDLDAATRARDAAIRLRDGDFAVTNDALVQR